MSIHLSKAFLSLLHHRWSVPVLAAFADLDGQAKFVTVQRRLDVSRSSLQRTLAALNALKLVRKNEGYGHPLRPEYLLTEAGRDVGSASKRMMQVLNSLSSVDVALRKWSIPVVRALAQRPTSFNALQAALVGITPRALSRAVRDLEDVGWVERRLQNTRPPRWEYGLTAKSSPVDKAAMDLQRRINHV
ncbi:MAG: winged helix-turn-helix transcriptional regulator [Myxococcota bacterium]